jgi:hypothetical protein
MHNKSSNWLKPNNIINTGACVFMIQLARCSHFTCIPNGRKCEKGHFCPEEDIEKILKIILLNARPQESWCRKPISKYETS